MAFDIASKCVFAFQNQKEGQDLQDYTGIANRGRPKKIKSSKSC